MFPDFNTFEISLSTSFNAFSAFLISPSIAGLTKDFTLATSPGKKDLYLKADKVFATALSKVLITPGSEDSPFKNLSSCFTIAYAAFLEAAPNTLDPTPAPAPIPAPYAAPFAILPKSKSSMSLP